jgi:sphinganine-1-phosphate aldolase
MEKFMFANPLHPDLFPAVRQMESDIVAMTSQLFNGTPRTCGTLTTGGTESLIMAMHAYREWGRQVKGISEPEIVACETVHVAIDKAAYYLGMTLVHVPVDPLTFKVDMRKLRRELNSNTVCIIGSAPNFANGIIDPIEELAVEAKRWNVGLHVDCCLGGFVVPFMEAAGYPCLSLTSGCLK